MNWNYLENLDQLKDLAEESNEKNILIFKHSTRCSTSRMVLDRLERSWNSEHLNVKPYFLDLLSYREISNALSQHYQTEHESPQVLIIRQNKSVFECSHFNIDLQNIKRNLKN